MEYSLFSRDAEEQRQINACKELGMAMMAYAVLGRGMLSDQVPRVEELAADDVRQRLPRFQSVNIEKNLGLRSALEAIARRKNATLAQLSIAWPMAQGKRAGVFIVPIPGAKSGKHLEENVRRRGYCAHGRGSCGNRPHRPARCRSGSRYPTEQMHRVNV